MEVSVVKLLFRLYCLSLVAALCSIPTALAGTDREKYTNPIIHADYSDPDAVRVGDDFYMISSSFNHAPALPILHSRDLVHWRLLGHVLEQQVPDERFSIPQHGNGVWAPSLRYHDDKFWVFYGDPDQGIFVITAEDMRGPWSEPHLLKEGKGLIDPTPLWDDDGKAYLLHAWAKSRSGINNVLTLHRMSADARKVLDKGKVVIDGNKIPGYRTLEGPKFYKRDGYYYVFAPAGGVAQGWQSAFRAKNIYGPYEEKVVMAQGNTPINGPHQGAWVSTAGGEDWFLHFQDKDAYGRIVHLQPMQWRDGWPVIGADPDGDGRGEPVLSHARPKVSAASADFSLAASDEFDTKKLQPQWQWNANWRADWYSLSDNPGHLRLFAQSGTGEAENLWHVPSLLLQKFPAEEFRVETKLRLEGDKAQAGLLVYGTDYAWLGLRNKDGKSQLIYNVCIGARGGCKTHEVLLAELEKPQAEIGISVFPEGRTVFSYRQPDGNWTPLNEGFIAQPGRWVGARFGLFAQGDNGHADFDYLHVK
ncbi:glycoside hydrolase family 43 protein [Microbulbifer rhizosphaerae]|uniref:Beta-xylosidase n=1 Tax=Microbulbifer rhizosphaerae TaxID=1562603 RepID=A0A7W4ZAC0_9GAMM|nr:glycoside hydrolase 43 family protein [Microbulbifer rhizosphaerae]MBB3062592.1 beta-xylosidase [Microbulbifer rhizosphaerae]